MFSNLLTMSNIGIFVVAFFLGVIFSNNFIKKKLISDGYDQQAYNSDANLALEYLYKGDFEYVEEKLNEIIERTGMGKRDILEGKNRVLLSEQNVKKYLDEAIKNWRERKNNTDLEEEKKVADCYIDAYQSVRVSLFDEKLPMSD